MYMHRVLLECRKWEKKKSTVFLKAYFLNKFWDM